MNILFDGRPLADVNSGGVKRVTEGLLQALKQQGVPITSATTGAIKPNGSDVHTAIPNKIVSLWLFLRLKSFEQLFSQKIDRLFFPNIGWIGKPKIPYALVVHDVSFLIEPAWFSWKSRLWHASIDARRQIKQAQVIFSVSETTKRDLTNILGIPQERIHVIPMGINLSSTHRKDRLIHHPYLLALGGGNRRKNTSLAKSIAVNMGLPLILIGEEPWMHPTDEELNSLYASATAFLYPSWYEGFGLPLHEAARFGTPCIASTAGALPETAPSGTIFASPAKPHHWIQAVKSIQKNPTQHQTHTNISTWDEAAKIIQNILMNQ